MARQGQGYEAPKLPFKMPKMAAGPAQGAARPKERVVHCESCTCPEPKPPAPDA